eukprot:jgi/Mesvir1/26564/Mv16219-RA.1
MAKAVSVSHILQKKKRQSPRRASLHVAQAVASKNADGASFTTKPRSIRQLEREIGPCEKLGTDAEWCKCRFCERKKQLKCTTPLCQRGRLHENRAYHPWGEMDCEGRVVATYTPEDVRADPMKYLMLTSVRCFDQTDETPATVIAPEWYDPERCATAGEHRGKKRAKAKKLKTQDAERDAVRFGLHAKDGVELPSPVHAAVERCVRVLAHTPVSRVYKRGEGVHASYAAWTKHRHCLNVGREHASNNVWFSVTYQGVSQRCFDEGCAGYASEPAGISASDRALLFGAPAPADANSQGRQTMAAAIKLATKLTRPTYRSRRRMCGAHRQ